MKSRVTFAGFEHLLSHLKKYLQEANLLNFLGS